MKKLLFYSLSLLILLIGLYSLMPVKSNKIMAYPENPAASNAIMLPLVRSNAGSTPPSNEDTLAEVQNRGFVKCGTRNNFPGLSYLNPGNNKYEGFDIDYCKVLAAAIFGDETAFQIVPVTGSTRFPLLQSGDIDVLLGTPWTLSRDSVLGFDFAPTTFYGGQGMLVRKNSGITDLFDLNGGTICVQAGTTQEYNLAEVMRQLGINYQPVVFSTKDETRSGYDSGQCDGLTENKSNLLQHHTLLTQPSAHTFLAETISKEPHGALTRHGDNIWGDVVMWSINCTIQAEELDVNSSNVDSLLNSDNPSIQNLLGVSGDLGPGLGLDDAWCYDAIKQIGNYGEIYDRHLGPGSSFKMVRALNELWINGGMIYSPPFE